ncbi:hypothetical protein DIPPA_60115 [Diplonema papillatum]|nr:hypothetical protein DIPPA_60115 [Diplonema papillatum]
MTQVLWNRLSLRSNIVWAGQPVQSLTTYRHHKYGRCDIIRTHTKECLPRIRLDRLGEPVYLYCGEVRRTATELLLSITVYQDYQPAVDRLRGVCTSGPHGPPWRVFIFWPEGFCGRFSRSCLWQQPLGSRPCSGVFLLKRSCFEKLLSKGCQRDRAFAQDANLL